jgi:hypothetical protein
MIHLRARAISRGNLVRVSISNGLEGLARATALIFCLYQFIELSFIQVLISYTAGNLLSLLPYLWLNREANLKPLESISINKIYGFAIIGLLGSLVTGGLPYVAGYFNANSISVILFFFTLTRSLLIIQSILVYVKPEIAKELGDGSFSKRIIKYFITLLFATHLLVNLLKYGTDTLLNIDLSTINQVDLFIYANALVISAFFNLKIASKNVTTQWSHGILSGLVGLSVACISFAMIDTGKNSFYTAMILAPLAGIFTLIQLDKR